MSAALEENVNGLGTLLSGYREWVEGQYFASLRSKFSEFTVHLKRAI